MENHTDVTGEGGISVDAPSESGLKMGNTPAAPKGTGNGDQTTSHDSDSGTDLNEDGANSPDEEKTSDDSTSVSPATSEDSSTPRQPNLESSETPTGQTDPDIHKTTSDLAVERSPDEENASDETVPAPQPIAEEPHQHVKTEDSETEEPSVTGGGNMEETELLSPETREDPEKAGATPGDTDTPDPSETTADDPKTATVEDKVESLEVVENKTESTAPAAATATTADATEDPIPSAADPIPASTDPEPSAADCAAASPAAPPITTSTTSTETLTASYFQAAGMDPGMLQLLKQMHPDIFVQMEAYNRLVSHVNTLGFSFRGHVPMDGNCMFHVVSDQLRRTQGPEMTHQELRSKAVDYLRDHPFTEGKQHLRSFVPDEKWDAYLAAMSRDGEWGDHIVLMALASVLRREIHVVSSTPGDDFLTKVKPNGGTDAPVTGPPLLLGNYAEQHYVSLDGPQRQRPVRQLSRQLSIEAPPPRDQQDKPEGMTFHTVCGPAVMLSPNKRSAHRLGVSDEHTTTSALVFSATPIKVDQEVLVEFSGFTDKGSGALFFGVTAVDPATWGPAELPASLAVDKQNIGGFWVWPIDHDLMTTGALLMFSVNCNGNLEYSSNVNGGMSKLQLASIPTEQPLWAVLDLQGRTQTVKFVDGEDKKKATVIWKKGGGPDSPPDINVVMGFLQNLLMDKIQILKSCAAVIREEETPERARKALTYLRKLTMNIIQNGDEEENRKVYMMNSEFKETILRAHSAQQFMVAAGWCQVDDMMVFTRTCDVLLQPTVEALDESLNALPEESFAEKDTTVFSHTTNQAVSNSKGATEETQPPDEKNALRDKIQIISTCAVIIKEQERPALVREALTTVRRMTNNILKHPDDQKFRKIRVANKTFQETVMKSTNAQQFVVAAGWQQVEDTMVFDRSSDDLLNPTLQIIDDLLSSLPWETPGDSDDLARAFVPQSTAEATATGPPKLVKEEKQDSDEDVPFLTDKDRSYVATLLSNIAENIPSTTDKEGESKKGHEASGESSPISADEPAGEKTTGVNETPGKTASTVPAAEAAADATKATTGAKADHDVVSTEDLPRENWLTPSVNELLEKETVKQAKLTLTTLWAITNNITNTKGKDDNYRKMTTRDIPYAEAITATKTTHQLFLKAGWKKLGEMLVFPQYGGQGTGPVLVALEEGLCNLDKDESPVPGEKTEASEGPRDTLKSSLEACMKEIEEKETTGQTRITLSTIRDAARRVRDNPADNKCRRISVRSEAAKNFMITAGWIQVEDMLIFPKYCDKHLDHILTTVEESLSKLPDLPLEHEDGENAEVEREPKETTTLPEEKEKAEEKVTEEKIAPKVEKLPKVETPFAASGLKAWAPAKTAGNKRQRLAFCSVHGNALELKDGGKTMRRLYATDDDTSAISFSNRPIEIGEKITVEISEYRSRHSEDGRGVVILGLTTEDPSTLSQVDLPACIIDWTAQNNYWARRVKGKFVGPGDELTFYLDKDGNLTYTLKDVVDEVHLCDIPTGKPLWAILDMDGGAMTLTYKDEEGRYEFRMPWDGWGLESDDATSPVAATSKLSDETPQTAEDDRESAGREATPAPQSHESPATPTVDADTMTEEERLAFAFQKFKQQVEDPAKEQPPEELIRLINAIRQRNEDGDSSDSEDEEDESNIASEVLGKLGSAFFETILKSELQHLFGRSTSTSEEGASGSGAGEPSYGLTETKASLEDRVQIVKACIETMEEEAGNERAIMSLTLIRQITRNVLDNLGDPKYRQVRMRNKSVSGDIMDVPTALQLLAAIGWVQSDNSFVLPSSADDLLGPTLKAVDESLRKLKGEETPADNSEETQTTTAEEEANANTSRLDAPTDSTEEVKATVAGAEAETAYKEAPTYRSDAVETDTPGEDLATDTAPGPMEEAPQEPETGLDVLKSKAAELLQEESPAQAWLVLTVLEKMLRDVVNNSKDETSRHVRHLLPPSALNLLVAAGCVQVENMIIFPTEMTLLQEALEVVVESQRTLTETKSDIREEPGVFAAGATEATEEAKQEAHTAPQEAHPAPQAASADTEAMRFNSVHGTAVLLTKDRSVARLLLDSSKPGSGIVFSDRPIVVDEKVSMQLTEYWYDRQGSSKGDLVLGVTTVDPFTVDSDRLPPNAIPHLTNKEGYWAMRIRRQRIVPGDVMTVFISGVGNLMYSVNDEDKGVLIPDLPTDQPLWVMMDMDGGVTALTFVQKDDKGSDQSSSPVDVVKEEDKHDAASSALDSDLYDSVEDLPLPDTHRMPQDEQPKPSEAASASPEEEKPDGSPEVDLNSMTTDERMEFIMNMQGEEFSLEEKTGLLKVCVDVIKEDETMEQAKTSLKYLMNRMSNLLNNPDDERYRQVYIRSGTFWDAMRPRSAQQFMVVAGWVQVGDNMVFPNYYDALIKPALDVLNECLSTFPPEPISLYGRKDPVGDAGRAPDTTAVEGMTFNEVHGSAIELSEDGRTATHRDDSTDTGSTITFSARQINANDEVCVKLPTTESDTATESDAASGTFHVGITTLDPSTLNLDDLPKQAADLKSSDGFWLWPLDDSLTDGGSVLKLYVSCTGNLTYCVDSKPPGGFISNIPTNQPLWVILVLQGRVGELTFVDEDTLAPAEPEVHAEETSSYPWDTEGDDLYDMEPTIPSYTNGASPYGEHLPKRSLGEKEALLREKIPILEACVEAIKEEAGGDKARVALSYIRMQTRKILNRPSSDEIRTIHMRDKMFIFAAHAATQSMLQFMVAAGWVIRGGKDVGVSSF
ncbi:NEURL1B [Branchiostoma lanceolatum]|uniref:NEURL1B protein n=1 Tax=Branchiostoma lanceolatum TaxID=7740 RepID=A0A8J9YLG5_BRALA|nr:NEURL1B [Branchiostoma lanceolatum]